MQPPSALVSSGAASGAIFPQRLRGGASPRELVGLFDASSAPIGTAQVGNGENDSQTVHRALNPPSPVRNQNTPIAKSPRDRRSFSNATWILGRCLCPRRLGVGVGSRARSRLCGLIPVMQGIYRGPLYARSLLRHSQSGSDGRIKRTHKGKRFPSRRLETPRLHGGRGSEILLRTGRSTARPPQPPRSTVVGSDRPARLPRARRGG